MFCVHSHRPPVWILFYIFFKKWTMFRRSTRQQTNWEPSTPIYTVQLRVVRASLAQSPIWHFTWPRLTNEPVWLEQKLSRVNSIAQNQNACTESQGFLNRSSCSSSTLWRCTARSCLFATVVEKVRFLLVGLCRAVVTACIYLLNGLLLTISQPTTEWSFVILPYVWTRLLLVYRTWAYKSISISSKIFV